MSVAAVFEIQKTYKENTKLISVAPDDILRSFESKRSVCARKSTLIPLIFWPRQMVLSMFLTVWSVNFLCCVMMHAWTHTHMQTDYVVYNGE